MVRYASSLEVTGVECDIWCGWVVDRVDACATLVAVVCVAVVFLGGYSVCGVLLVDSGSGVDSIFVVEGSWDKVAGVDIAFSS